VQTFDALGTAVEGQGDLCEGDRHRSTPLGAGGRVDATRGERGVTTVGIMSMQRIFNYGSTLQAYGLRRLVTAVTPDADVRFVDFRPGEVLVNDGSVSRSKLGRIVAKVREYNDVDTTLRRRLAFFEHKRSYGARYFPLVGIQKDLDRDLDVDVQVIGSDEVFNCVQANTNVGYSRDLFGHGSPARRVISYAASFGNTTMSKIKEYGIADELAADLDRFAAISVRDRNSAEIVRALLGHEPEVHVDPALAYDYMGVEQAIPTRRLHDGKYLIVYGYSGRLSRAENVTLAGYARRIGARILCFGGVQECCDEFVDADPFELLAYFRDAEAVVTDTFHGTIFAMINHRPFATIVRPSGASGYGNEEKLGFLLEMFGLSSQRLNDMSQIGEVLARPIDFEMVDGLLSAERARANDFLASSIGAVRP
jgi:hypothetical protein